MDLLQKQYQLVVASRAVLLRYFGPISPARFMQPVPGFAHESMAGLHTHVANVYVYWIGKIAMEREPVYFHTEPQRPVSALHENFGLVDALVADFFRRFPDPDEQLHRKMEGEKGPRIFTALEIFTHAITHEFHHKGQLLTMSRLLGYAPVDTDLIRT
ncbi:MAG: DinB family protein [Mucilaginibacter polytrichastri]|nr:DinB family protein [Mucilaginibacter polytrichastri]